MEPSVSWTTCHDKNGNPYDLGWDEDRHAVILRIPVDGRTEDLVLSYGEIREQLYQVNPYASDDVT
jgi:hypothetical protein